MYIVSFLWFHTFQEVHEHMCFAEVVENFVSWLQLQRGNFEVPGHVFYDFRVFYWVDLHDFYESIS